MVGCCLDSSISREVERIGVVKGMEFDVDPPRLIRVSSRNLPPCKMKGFLLAVVQRYCSRQSDLVPRRYWCPGTPVVVVVGCFMLNMLIVPRSTPQFTSSNARAHS